jgi:hypothetical protein
VYLVQEARVIYFICVQLQDPGSNRFLGTTEVEHARELLVALADDVLPILQVNLVETHRNVIQTPAIPFFGRYIYEGALASSVAAIGSSDLKCTDRGKEGLTRLLDQFLYAIDNETLLLNPLSKNICPARIGV